MYEIIDYELHKAATLAVGYLRGNIAPDDEHPGTKGTSQTFAAYQI